MSHLRDESPRNHPRRRELDLEVSQAQARPFHAADIRVSPPCDPVGLLDRAELFTGPAHERLERIPGSAPDSVLARADLRSIELPLGSAPDPSPPSPATTTTAAAGPPRRCRCHVTRLNCRADNGPVHCESSGRPQLLIWPAEQDSGFAAPSTLRHTVAQRAAVLAALAAPCVGAPRLSYVITAGPPSSIGIDLILHVTTSGGSVTLGPDTDCLSVPPFYGGPTYVRGSRGRVTLSGQLTAGCSSPISQSSPQLLRAVVKVGAHIFPYRIWFDTKAVLEVESRLCGQFPDPAQARSNGWAV